MYENDSGSLLNSCNVKVKRTLIFLFHVAAIVLECEHSTLIKMCPFPTTSLFVLQSRQTNPLEDTIRPVQ